MGGFWLGQFPKYMIKHMVWHFECPKAAGSSEGDFGLVVQPFENTAQKCNGCNDHLEVTHRRARSGSMQGAARAPVDNFARQIIQPA